jgi:hypothetical protein
MDELDTISPTSAMYVHSVPFQQLGTFKPQSDFSCFLPGDHALRHNIKFINVDADAALGEISSIVQMVDQCSGAAGILTQFREKETSKFFKLRIFLRLGSSCDCKLIE